MRIFEEYLYRHNIDVPVIEHCSRGVLVLKNEVIINIFWQNQKNTIGFYRFNECKLKYNYIRPFNFNKIYWHDYENFLKNWIANNDNIALFDKNEVFYFFCKIFLKCNKIKSCEIEKRCIESCIKKSNSKFLLSSWQCYKNYMNNYSYWLAKIVNQSVLQKQRNYDNI